MPGRAVAGGALPCWAAGGGAARWPGVDRAGTTARPRGGRRREGESASGRRRGGDCAAILLTCLRASQGLCFALSCCKFVF